MLLVPFAVGALSSGLDWRQLPVLAALIVGYFAFFATGLWLRSRCKRKYRPPVLAYGSATAVLGIIAIWVDSALLGWAPILAPLLALSLWFSWRRRERTLANDGVVVVATSLMTVVASGIGAGIDGSLETKGFSWLPGAGDPHSWVLAGFLALYFGGTVLYVKSMIRDRGDLGRYRLSVGYHLVACAPAFAAGPALGAVFVVLALRAMLVPRWWPAATPAAIGIGEIVASVAVAAVLLGL